MSINSRLLASLLTICLLLVVPIAGFAVTGDAIVGGWNLKGSGPGSPTFVAVMTFDAGGTTAEFDSSGNNPSGSPGESIALGKWRKTADLTYTFKEENYIYNASGNLSFIAVTTANIDLSSTLNSFTGTLVTKFFRCSVSACPGTFFTSSPSLTLSGKRF